LAPSGLTPLGRRLESRRVAPAAFLFTHTARLTCRKRLRRSLVCSIPWPAGSVLSRFRRMGAHNLPKPASPARARSRHQFIVGHPRLTRAKRHPDAPRGGGSGGRVPPLRWRLSSTARRLAVDGAASCYDGDRAVSHGSARRPRRAMRCLRPPTHLQVRLGVRRLLCGAPCNHPEL
jgi:hypothetical protein